MKKGELENKIIQLRLHKRHLILSGKNTKQIDKEIKIIQNKLEELLQIGNK